MNRVCPPRVLASRPRRLGRAPVRRTGVGDILGDLQNLVSGNSPTDTSTDTSSTDTTDTTDTSGDTTGTSSVPGVTPPPGPTGLAAVPAWAWVAGAGVAGIALYELVLRK